MKLKQTIYFGDKKFVCELKEVLVCGRKKTIERVFCKEVKRRIKKKK